MSIANKFENFIKNLYIPNNKIEIIKTRYHNITKKLNKDFWNKNSNTEHSLYIGSYGRDTEIKTSDIDMIFWLPYEKYKQYDNYKGYGQSALLQEVKNSLKETYSQTSLKADGPIIAIDFSDGICFELLPCFENEDESFTYPDTNHGGSWKITKPRAEMQEIQDKNNEWNKNLKRLCRMTRAWKDEYGVLIGGLLIDTLAYNFLKDWEYKYKSYSYYDYMVRDFFEYLKKQDKDKKYWYAVGSNQKVYRKGKFEAKAKKAYNLALEAIEYEENQDEKYANEKWGEIFGRVFNKGLNLSNESENWYDNTEEFIEDKFDVNIKYNLKIDCEVTQDGFRPLNLLDMLLNNILLKANKKLKFEIIKTDAPECYDIYWKVLNRGYEAKKRNMIRGQIIQGKKIKEEHTEFKGEHLVECYIVKNNVVVARDRIDVPISENKENI